MTRAICAALCLLTLAGLVAASEPPCHYQTVYEFWPGGYWHGRYYPAGYYAVSRPVAVLYLNRTYSISYDSDTAALVEAIDRVAKAVESLRGPRAEAKATDGPGVIRQRCASCHAGANPKGGFVLVRDNGEPALLAIEDRAKVLARVHSPDPRHRMPPDKPLPAAESKLLTDFLFQKE